MDDKIEMDLSELFPFWKEGFRVSKDLLIALEPDTDLVREILLDIGLSYVGDEEISTNSVCMANADEVLPAYRTIVTRLDFIYFALHAIHENVATKKEEGAISIAAPQSSADFWNGVEKGRQRL